MFIMPDKTARFFYALFGPLPEGDQIAMSIGTQAGNSNSSPSPSSSPTVLSTPVVTQTTSPSVAPTPQPTSKSTPQAKLKTIT